MGGMAGINIFLPALHFVSEVLGKQLSWLRKFGIFLTLVSMTTLIFFLFINGSEEMMFLWWRIVALNYTYITMTYKYFLKNPYTFILQLQPNSI